MTQAERAHIPADPLPAEQADEPAAPAVRRRNYYIALAFDLLLIAALTLPIAFWNLGERSLGVPDEVFEAGAAIETAQTGNWLLPTVNGQAFFDKPPLKMWLSSAAAELFGPSNFTYRLIDALAGAGTMLLTYLLGRMLFASRLVGLLAVFSFLGCRIFVIEHGMRTAVQDSLLVFLCTAATLYGWRMLGIVEAGRGAGARRILWFSAAAAGICVGAAVLTKSAGGVMPLLVFGVFLLLSGRLLRFLREAWGPLLLGGAAAAAIGGSYFAYHCTATPGACEALVMHHIVRRVAGGIHDVSGPEFFMIRIFQHRAAFPPELLVIALAAGAGMWAARRDPRFALLLVWSVLPVLLYSFASTKFSWYIAPAFPAMAVLIAAVLLGCRRYAAPRLRAWWAGDSREPLRMAAVSLVLLYGLGITAYRYADNLLWVAEDRGRIPADLAVSDILKEQELSGRVPNILSFQAPSASVGEWPYFRMLRPLVTRITDERALEEALSGPPPDYFISDLHSFRRAAEAWGIRRYTFLMPNLLRSEWISITAFNEGASLNSFTLWKNVIDFGSAALEPMYGFGGPEQFNGLPVRWITGDRGAIAVPGDPALQLMGASIFLNMSPNVAPDGEPLSLAVSINGVVSAELPLEPFALRTYEFGVPPDVLRSGTNAVQFTMQGADIPRTMRAAMFNWISIRLAQKLPPGEEALR